MFIVNIHDLIMFISMWLSVQSCFMLIQCVSYTLQCCVRLCTFFVMTNISSGRDFFAYLKEF